MTATRYAIYYAPASDHPLGLVGARWLGRDAASDRATAQPDVAGIPHDRVAELTADPRRYGFHGTLKPPFALAAGCSEADLIARARAVASRHGRFVIPALTLARLGSFFALVPTDRIDALHDLADDCVRDLDDLRAPPDASEIARRQSAGLSVEQEAFLARWGYPYVFSQFRFHLTLTGRVPPAEADAIQRALDALTRPLCGVPVSVDDIVVFVERRPPGPFTILDRLPLRPAG